MAFYGYDPMALPAANAQARGTFGQAAMQSFSNMSKDIGGIVDNARKQGKEKELKNEAYMQSKGFALNAGLNPEQVPAPRDDQDFEGYFANLSEKIMPNMVAQLKGMGKTSAEISALVGKAPKGMDTMGLTQYQSDLKFADEMNRRAAAYAPNPAAAPTPVSAPDAMAQPTVAPYGSPAGAGSSVTFPDIAVAPTPATPTEEVQRLSDKMARVGFAGYESAARDPSHATMITGAANLEMKQIELEITKLETEQAKIKALQQAATTAAGDDLTKASMYGFKVIEKATGKESGDFDAMRSHPGNYEVTGEKAPNVNIYSGGAKPPSQKSQQLLNTLQRSVAALGKGAMEMPTSSQGYKALVANISVYTEAYLNERKKENGGTVPPDAVGAVNGLLSAVGIQVPGGTAGATPPLKPAGTTGKRAIVSFE